jgi:hypothetical protein
MRLSGEPEWNYAEMLTRIHPLEALVDLRVNHSKEVIKDKTIRYEYHLINWMEVSKEMYDRCKDHVG